MTQNEKFQIQRRNTLRNLWQKLSGTPDFPVKLVLAALYLMGAAYVCVKQAAWRTLAGNIPLPSPLLKAAMEHALLAYLLAGAAALLALLLYPFGRRAAKDQLQCIGLVNHAGVPPDLLRKRRDKDNPRVTVWEFRNNSIPLQEWEKRQAAIETALGLTIVKLAYAKGKSRVLVYAVSAGDDLPEVLKWKDSYLSPKSFVLVLGESYTGPVTVNLAHIPHILLGGSTGSGKSVLLKLLLMQALHKGAEVYITDFKGGVDFPKVWHEKCRMCFTEENLRYTLDQLVAVLEYRKNAFKALGCPNIDAYNEIAERPLQRLIFACDEVAEMLDKTGADNERKKLLAQIGKQALHHRAAGAGVRHPSHSCHAEAGCDHHPRSDTQQHGFPCLRQGGQRAFSNYSRQHRRRRSDTQGCTGPFHHRRRYGVSRLPVRRGAALTG